MQNWGRACHLGNFWLNLVSKPTFTWSQDLCLWGLVSAVFLFFSVTPFSSYLQGRKSSNLHEIIISCLSLLFQVISPTGTEAEPIIVLFLPHNPAGVPKCPVLRSPQGGAGMCSDKAVLPHQKDGGGWQTCIPSSCCPLQWLWHFMLKYSHD